MIMPVLILSTSDPRTRRRGDDRQNAVFGPLTDESTLRELDPRAGAIPHGSAREVDRDPDLTLILHSCQSLRAVPASHRPVFF